MNRAVAETGLLPQLYRMKNYQAQSKYMTTNNQNFLWGLVFCRMELGTLVMPITRDTYLTATAVSCVISRQQ